MDPVGIFAVAKLTQHAFDRFCKDHGQALVDDWKYILANDKGELLTPDGYYHHPRNQLVIQYETESQTLFYLYILELRNPDAMEVVPSFIVFKNISAYKDIESSDLVLFSSSMPNLNVDPVWRAYEVGPSIWTKTDEEAVSESTLKELSRLARKYYFDLGDRLDGETLESSELLYPWLLCEPLLSLARQQ